MPLEPTLPQRISDFSQLLRRFTMIRFTVVSLLSLILLAASPGMTSATVLNVCKDDCGELDEPVYNVIQDAVDAAAYGDTVLVWSVVYDE
jgi:hypothetical protein